MWPKLLFALILVLGMQPGGATDADGRPVWMPTLREIPAQEVLVNLAPSASLAQLCRDTRTTAVAQIPDSRSFRLRVTPGSGTTQLLERLRRDPRVLAADPNAVMPTLDANQLIFTFDGNLPPALYAEHRTIPLVNFGAMAQAVTGADVTVAVVDTGLSPRHAELAAAALPGWNFVDDSPTTDDVPDSRDNNNNGRVDEAVGHGTMIAGIIHRFAPKAHLLPVKVLNSDGSGTLWDAVQGIYFAVDRGAAVLNLSFGMPKNSKVLSQAIEYAEGREVTIVTSAGNSDSVRPQYPAGNKKAITVAGLNDDRTKAHFSNYGHVVDVDAPGVRIVSTYWDGSYAAWSGTSFSAAIVSAQAALVRSYSPWLSAESVRQRILETSHSVDDVNPDYRDQLGRRGAGLIDFEASLAGM